MIRLLLLLLVYIQLASLVQWFPTKAPPDKYERSLQDKRERKVEKNSSEICLHISF